MELPTDRDEVVANILIDLAQRETQNRSIVFARSGIDVGLWDPVQPALPAALEFIAARLPELHDAGLV